MRDANACGYFRDGCHSNQQMLRNIHFGFCSTDHAASVDYCDNHQRTRDTDGRLSGAAEAEKKKRKKWTCTAHSCRTLKALHSCRHSAPCLTRLALSLI